MVNIVDNRMEHSYEFCELKKGDFFVYKNDLYEVCETFDNGIIHQQAIDLASGDVIIDFEGDELVQPVKVTISIDKNL